jgi:DNA-binding response OmpR family regulator
LKEFDAMLFIISAPDKEVNGLQDQLKIKGFPSATFDNIFECKKRAAKETPVLLLVADNFKEKSIADLMSSLRKIDGLKAIPIIALIMGDRKNSVIDFFEEGAIDAVYQPFNIEEVVARINLRINESRFQHHFTSNEFFWNEAQEKDQGKRTGIFRFYDVNNTEIGNIMVKNGRVVSAAYGSLIKEDAFLQLTCNEELRFVFEDTEDVPVANVNESITNLLMEAAKLKDEIKKQEGDNPEDTKVLVIDDNRIARIMASRAVKKMGFECKVTGPEEMTVRFMANFAPQLIVVNYEDAEAIMNMLWPKPRTENDIPIIIYCDEDVNDINFTSIKNHHVSATVYKKKFHDEVKGLFEKVNILK